MRFYEFLCPAMQTKAKYHLPIETNGSVVVESGHSPVEANSSVVIEAKYHSPVETNSSVVIEASSSVEAKANKWPILDPVESKYYLPVETEYHSSVEAKYLSTVEPSKTNKEYWANSTDQPLVVESVTEKTRLS